MAAKKARSRVRRDGLVYRHLENASRELFDAYPDVIRNFVGTNAGVYALYKKKKLYYVGLAKGLRSRLKAHGRNRHSESWDSFSIYLTKRVEHLREIESLLIRIASPRGNTQRGKLVESQDMRRALGKVIQAKQRSEFALLLGRETRSKKPIQWKEIGDVELQKLFPQGAKLKGTLKGRVYRARIQRNGKVKFAGVSYNSLSKAAHAALKRPTNGWRFWQIERGRHNWVRLQEIRKARTPVYVR